MQSKAVLLVDHNIRTGIIDLVSRFTLALTLPGFTLPNCEKERNGSPRHRNTETMTVPCVVITSYSAKH